MSGSPANRFPRRPPRIIPFREVHRFYFVTFCTQRRASLLANAEVHDAFRSYASRANSDHGIAVGRYVIMPDHIHLFVALPDDGHTLSQWMGGLKRRLGTVLKKLGRPRPYWQEGFFDHLMRNTASYDTKWHYVRENPVRAELCSTSEDWPFAGEVTPLSFS